MAETTQVTKEELQARIQNVPVVGGKKRYGQELREAIVKFSAPHLATGQSLVTVAGELGMKAWTLQRWHQNARKPARRLSAKAPSAMTFVRLEAARPTPQQHPQPSLEVVLGNGRVVRVPAGFDEGLLSRVLAVAEGGA
jgi:transposase-like protein